MTPTLSRPNATASGPVQFAAPSPRGPLCILVLEPSARDARIVAAAVTRGQPGAKLSRVATLAQALDLLRSRTFDVILADADLPGAQGLAALEALHLACPTTALAAYTANGETMPLTAYDAYCAGAQDFIQNLEAAPAADLAQRLECAAARSGTLAQLGTGGPGPSQAADAVGDLVCAIGLDGRYSIWNRAFSQAMGGELALRGHRYDEAPDGAPNLAQAGITEAFGGGRTSREVRMRTAAGIRLVLWTGAPLRDAGGTVVQVVAVGRDVTDLRAQDREAAVVAVAIEHGVRLDAQDRAETRLLSRLAQEINKLAVLGQQAATVARDAAFLPPRSQEALRDLVHALSQATLAAAGLRSKGPAHGGRLRLERQDADLSTLVAGLAASVAGKCLAKGVELKSGCTGTARVHADVARVAQAARNLLDNALAATPAGGVVTLHGDAAGGGFNLWVSDTGHGFARGHAPVATDPFLPSQAVAAGRAHLGLGLRHAESIAKAHGGHLVAASDGVGKGATFRLFIPMAREVAP